MSSKKLKVTALMYVPIGETWPRVKLFSSDRAAKLHANRLVNGEKHVINSLDDCFFLELPVQGVISIGIFGDLYEIQDNYPGFTEKQFKKLKTYKPHRKLKVDSSNIEKVLKSVKVDKESINQGWKIEFIQDQNLPDDQEIRKATEGIEGAKKGKLVCKGGSSKYVEGGESYNG